MSQRLNELAHKQNVAVVLINQMTTKVESKSEGGTSSSSSFVGGHSRLVPALGESWAHAATHRVQLFWGHRPDDGDDEGGGDRNFGGSSVASRHFDAVRYAKVIKSSRRKDQIAPYTVTALGVRDLKTKKKRQQQQQQQQHQLQHKRERSAQGSAPH